MTQPPIERPWDKPKPGTDGSGGGITRWINSHPWGAIGIIGGGALLLALALGSLSGSKSKSDAGGGGGGMSLSQAFCSDLAKGLTPMNILGGQVKSGELAPSEAADKAYGMAAISCPGQLQTNDALRAYLQNWGIDPDA